MKEIAIISGKGGTGKTVVAGCLAALAEKKVMVDCDVDAANLQYLLHPEIQKEEVFQGGKTAVIDQERCIQCGKCSSFCRFEAIKKVEDNEGRIEKVEVDPLNCEGCGVCAYICPVDAVQLFPQETGKIFISETPYGPLVHAQLKPPGENSGKLVSFVREKAQELAERREVDFVIIDGPPGIGCPVISSISGVDLVLIITEPTTSGISDLERVLQLVKYFKTSSAICINKCDLNSQNVILIEEIAAKYDSPVLGSIPFGDFVIDSVVAGLPYVDYRNDETAALIKNFWFKLREVFPE